MSTTISDPSEAFVWVWLPGAPDPVVAGRLARRGEVVTFNYGRSYLDRNDAIPLYLPELPLEPGEIPPRVGVIAGCIADAGPDAWGQRVILNHRMARGIATDMDLDPLTSLLESGSDRIGALDFQASAEEYVPRDRGSASVSELAQAAAMVEEGEALPPTLDQALLHGSSVGGARPKALLRDGARRLIAKFSSTTDTHPVVNAEFLAMELARRAGIDVAPVALTRALERDVLLITRFDRTETGGRRAMVSALTILELDELWPRYASYADLSHIVRARFTDATHTLREIFSRITFNILVGNTDDHARNHAAFWDGVALSLTPAYDICPQPRGGGEASQAMIIGEDGFRMSRLDGCVERAGIYRLRPAEARRIIDAQIEVIHRDWDEVCDLARLGSGERAALWGRQFLNPYATQGY